MRVRSERVQHSFASLEASAGLPLHLCSGCSVSPHCSPAALAISSRNFDQITATRI